MTATRIMLEESRIQFQLYAKSHREKAERYNHQLSKLHGDPKADRIDIINTKHLLDETIKKAEVNESMVQRIQRALEESKHEGIEATAKFADVAYLEGVSDKNRQTQLGVHFEEVAEMLDTLSSNDAAMRYFIENAMQSLHDLSSKLKSAEPCVFIKNRIEFLDACCDQLVTATLSAKLQGMDIEAGLKETNRSNDSKLIDGVMMKDPITKKWIKGPNYTKPDLKNFV